MSAALTRCERTERRNQRLRDAFYAHYTNLPRPRKYSREYVIAQLSEEYHLSLRTVERILYRK
ncbi:hypothetical protein [Hymenobacter nivis]|uniref:Uncharacterized protein n=1 Tax=Hymenobacter nivis TaxID=1850093 RepID=A0A2Z3GD40_9BACT|nr:hypothetical protein [Hymenobacter nivis]AWM31343.1 hypothetical protein DDQ68_00205 [Hymenobacter nivis]